MRKVYTKTLRNGYSKQLRVINPSNLAVYNPYTWAEWSKVNATADSTGAVMTSNASTYGSIKLNTQLKNNTKYGVLFNILQNSLVNNSIYCSIAGTVLSPSQFIASGMTGSKKGTGTTGTISSNQLSIGFNSTGDAGLTVKLNNVRLFELAPGSQLEWDFNNLTADQLNTKYPF